jgi:hypothetical protein
MTELPCEYAQKIKSIELANIIAASALRNDGIGMSMVFATITVSGTTSEPKVTAFSGPIDYSLPRLRDYGHDEEKYRIGLAGAVKKRYPRGARICTNRLVGEDMRARKPVVCMASSCVFARK